MGRRAIADNLGSFAWNDSSGATFLSTTAPNQFLARASGGFKLISSAASDVTTDVELTNGSGAWADLSSESSKTSFREIDTRDYLRRVAALGIKEWSYKSEDPNVTHVGPTAEEFYALFGHGPSPRRITTVDASGVALAAIQGLYELVREQQAEIERLKELMIDDR